MRTLTALIVALVMALSGCTYSTPVNPSFPVTFENACGVLRHAEANPKPLDRPLVIVGGFCDTGLWSSAMVRDFRGYTHDDRIIFVPLDFSLDLDDYRKRVITAVQKTFPSTDPNFTTDVDVIGISMGGVAARYAAVHPLDGRRLQIHRLFTIASPNDGLVSTEGVPIKLIPVLDNLDRNSAFLYSLNHTSDPNAMYPVYPYACLGDWLVGAAFAAPPGQKVWWVSAPIWIDSHNWSWNDPRIRADILRRLRDEMPLTADPPAPLPAAEIRMTKFEASNQLLITK
jgi:pimeloyl-ACP methyl ester carboxylesterase